MWDRPHSCPHLPMSGASGPLPPALATSHPHNSPSAPLPATPPPGPGEKCFHPPPGAESLPPSPAHVLGNRSLPFPPTSSKLCCRRLGVTRNGPKLRPRLLTATASGVKTKGPSNCSPPGLTTSWPAQTRGGGATSAPTPDHLQQVHSRCPPFFGFLSCGVTSLQAGRPPHGRPGEQGEGHPQETSISIDSPRPRTPAQPTPPLKVPHGRLTWDSSSHRKG